MKVKYYDYLGFIQTGTIISQYPNRQDPEIMNFVIVNDEPGNNITEFIFPDGKSIYIDGIYPSSSCEPIE